VYICVCTSMTINIHIYLHIYTYLYVCVYVHIYMYVSVYVYIPYTHICMYEYVYIYSCKHTNVHTLECQLTNQNEGNFVIKTHRFAVRDPELVVLIGRGSCLDRHRIIPQRQ